MNKAFSRLAVVFGLMAAGVLSSYRLVCDMPGAEEPGARLLQAALGKFLDGVALSATLEARLKSNHRRIQAKHEVVTKLLAGRLTLRDAAARFGELDAGLPGFRERLRQQYPGEPYEEALCREVIEHARSVLRARAPLQLKSVVARLEAELQAHLESEAGFRLL